MCRSLQLLPCIRAKEPQSGKTQLKKWTLLPVACSCLEQAPFLSLHRKSFCRKTMAYLWRTRPKCQRGSSRRQSSPVLSVERTVGHQERLFLSFFCFHMTKLCDPVSSAFPEHVTGNACTCSSWDLSDRLRNGGGGSPMMTARLWPDLARLARRDVTGIGVGRLLFPCRCTGFCDIWLSEGVLGMEMRLL